MLDRLSLQIPVTWISLPRNPVRSSQSGEQRQHQQNDNQISWLVCSTLKPFVCSFVNQTSRWLFGCMYMLVLYNLQATMYLYIYRMLVQPLNSPLFVSMQPFRLWQDDKSLDERGGSTPYCYCMEKEGDTLLAARFKLVA